MSDVCRVNPAEPCEPPCRRGARLSTGAKFLLCFFRNLMRASEINGFDYVWSKQEAIAEHTGMCARSIRRYLAELVEAGLVEVCRATGKLARGNNYRLLEAAEAADPEPPETPVGHRPQDTVGHRPQDTVGHRPQDTVGLPTPFAPWGINLGSLQLQKGVETPAAAPETIQAKAAAALAAIGVPPVEIEVNSRADPALCLVVAAYFAEIVARPRRQRPGPGLAVSMLRDPERWQFVRRRRTDRTLVPIPDPDTPADRVDPYAVWRPPDDAQGPKLRRQSDRRKSDRQARAAADAEEHRAAAALQAEMAAAEELWAGLSAADRQAIEASVRARLSTAFATGGVIFTQRCRITATQLLNAYADRDRWEGLPADLRRRAEAEAQREWPLFCETSQPWLGACLLAAARLDPQAMEADR